MQSLSPVPDFHVRKSTRRDPWTEDEARAVLSAASRSGLSLSAFARRHGLSDRTLYWWRTQLRSHPNVESATSMFARICTDSSPSREVSAIEIVVADAVIRVSQGFDQQTLAQVVAALKSCG